MSYFQGSYEIHSYCLGHTKFTTSAAAIPAQAAAGSSAQRHLVVSASGDGTIRLWDVDSGQQLSCYVASEQPPPLSFQQQQEEAGGGPEEEQQGQAGGDDGAEGEGSDGEGQQEEQAQGDDKADAAEGDAAVAAANGADKQQGERQGNAAAAARGAAAAAAGGAGTGKHQGRYHKARETCCAVLCVAVSPDGSTVAAAVEGQQELQILSLSAASGELQLQQKLAFADVANPAAVVFDSQGRLWAVGGVLARETESAHVGVAARDAGARQ
jgi:WD40 repeat protein